MAKRAHFSKFKEIRRRHPTLPPKKYSHLKILECKNVKEHCVRLTHAVRVCNNSRWTFCYLVNLNLHMAVQSPNHYAIKNHFFMITTSQLISPSWGELTQILAKIGQIGRCGGPKQKNFGQLLIFSIKCPLIPTLVPWYSKWNESPGS